MKNKIYKLSFPAGVHFGKKDLTETEITFGADTLFSALALEALRMEDGLFQNLYDSVNQNKLLFSDACPYVGNRLYVPKPFVHIEREKSDVSSKQKKAAKKLKYLPTDHMDVFFAGNLDLENEVKTLGKLGKKVEKVSVSIYGEEEPKPYRVASYCFNEDCGLYICVRYEAEEHLQLFETLLDALSYSGIGGERSSGYGRFTFKCEEMPESLAGRFEGNYQTYMALSSCMASQEELDAVVVDACFQLKKRSGFVDSGSKGNQNLRKKDYYMFCAGSCFKKKFYGEVVDVTRTGSHPVYRYAKAMLIGVNK